MLPASALPRRARQWRPKKRASLLAMAWPTAQKARRATQRSQRWRMTAPAEFLERAMPAPWTAKPTRIRRAPSAPMIKRKSMAAVPYTRGAGGGETLQRRGGGGEVGEGRGDAGTEG